MTERKSRAPGSIASLVRAGSSVGGSALAAVIRSLSAVRPAASHCTRAAR